MGSLWAANLRNEDKTVTMTKTSYYIEAGTKVTLTAKDGYQIKNLRLETQFYKEEVPEATGKTEFTFEPRKLIKDTATTQDLYIYVTTEEAEEKQIVTLSMDLDSGLTTKFDKDELEQSDTIEISTKDYYRFKGNVEVMLNSDKYEYNYLDNSAYFRDNGQTFALRMETKWRDDLETVSIKARTESFVVYSIELENAVTNFLDNEIEQTDGIVVTANNRYDFNNGVTIVYKRNGVNERITYTPKKNSELFEEDGTEFFIDFADVWSDDLQEIQVIAKAQETPPPKEAVLSQVLENVSSNITGNHIQEDEDLILIANEGYEFKDLIKITLTRKQNNGSTRTYLPHSASDSVYFSEDNTVFKINMSELWEWDMNVITVEAGAKESYIGDDDEDLTDSSTDFANIYYTDSGILASISAERFSKSQTGGTEGQGDLPIDMGSYIYQVYKFPMKLQEDLISESESKVQMGFYDLETTSRYMLRSRVKFDLGTITVPETYHNIYDYRDTQCLLHVPYAEPIEIEPTYVIGQMIDLAYFLDLYNGKVTLEVYSDKIEGGLVQREEVPVVFDIPFIQPQYNSVVNKVGGYINNKVKTPHIEVVRNVPYDPSTIFGKEGKEYDKLKEFKGYVEVADLDLSSTATVDEQDEIEALLAQGVIINKPQDKTIITN